MKTQTNPKNVKNITKKQLKNVEKSIIILDKALFRPPEGIFWRGAGEKQGKDE